MIYCWTRRVADIRSCYYSPTPVHMQPPRSKTHCGTYFASPTLVSVTKCRRFGGSASDGGEAEGRERLISDRGTMYLMGRVMQCVWLGAGLLTMRQRLRGKVVSGSDSELFAHTPFRSPKPIVPSAHTGQPRSWWAGYSGRLVGWGLVST